MDTNSMEFVSAYDKTVILDLVCHLDTLVEQMHDVAACHKSLDVPVQALRRLEFRFLVCQSQQVYLCQSRKKVEGDNHEVLVRLLELLGVLHVGDVLVEGLLHQGDAPLIHRLAVWQEALL